MRSPLTPASISLKAGVSPDDPDFLIGAGLALP
jgi:hypothetical protein